MKSNSARMASLDGFRAISILLVVVSHLYASPAVVRVTRYLWRWELGNLGVRVFFVISGFLITSLLMAERARTGKISLRGFYIRRLFRIAPAYYALLIAATLLIPLGLVNVDYRDVSAAAVYISNYWRQPWSLGHTWSLSVEEQFYLLWPCTLMLLGNRRAVWCAVVCILLVPLLRTADLQVHWDDANYSFETVADALATGCLLALIRERLWSNDTYRRLLQLNWFWLLPLVLVIALGRSPKIMWNAAIGLTILNIGIAITLDRYMRLPGGPIGLFLNTKPMVWIGMLSYSIYLWHTLFILRPGMPHQLVFPLNVGCVLLAATGSYYLIEKPLLAFRERRFATRNSDPARHELLLLRGRLTSVPPKRA